MITRLITDNLKFIAEFGESLKNPRGVQERLLLRIIKRNKNTVYGKKYGFKNIKSIADYQKRVPIITYENILAEIEMLKKGAQNILTKDEVIYFATTSGTTKSVKLIPVTAERARIFRRELSLWGFYVLRKHRKVLSGKTLYFAGPPFEFKTEGGVQCGSISGYLAHKSPWFVKSKLVVNPKIYNEMNFEKKTRMIALSALQSKITQIGFASPIEAILFFDYLSANKDSLLKELKRKGKNKDYKRLKKLKEFKPAFIWPELFLINCIKSKTNQTYLETLKEKIGKKDIAIKDPGIYSSEGRLSLCIDEQEKGVSGIIPANENFFEFIEMKEGLETGKPLTVDSLKKGREYLVIMTTPEGLYRYNMEDVVRVTGFKKKLPLIEFVNRNNYLNIAGELAHENILVDVMQETARDSRIELRAFTFTPCTDNPRAKPRYEVLVETTKPISDPAAKSLAKKLEENLQKTISDYKQMRNEFGRMDPLTLSILKKGSYDSFDKKRVTGSGQPKPIFIAKDSSFKKNFEIEKRFELK